MHAICNISAPQCFTDHGRFYIHDPAASPVNCAGPCVPFPTYDRYSEFNLLVRTGPFCSSGRPQGIAEGWKRIARPDVGSSHFRAFVQRVGPSLRACFPKNGIHVIIRFCPGVGESGTTRDERRDARSVGGWFVLCTRDSMAALESEHRLAANRNFRRADLVTKKAFENSLPRHIKLPAIRFQKVEIP
jgi:hypothetical protein